MSLGAKALVKCRGEPSGSPTEALASVRRSLYQCGAPSRIVQAIQLVRTIADSSRHSDPFARCHSERVSRSPEQSEGEESHSAQDRLREESHCVQGKFRKGEAKQSPCK